MKITFYKFKNRIIDLCKFIQIDFSFLLIFILAIFVREIKFYFLYVLFLTLHELLHYLVAKKLGYLPNKMKLTFFGASLEGYDDFVVEDEIKIVLAGPLFNLIVIVCCYLSYWFWPESYIYLNDILNVNLMILLFNVLPVFPLDMGRLILALLSIKFDRNSALKIIKTISFSTIMILFCVFILTIFFNFNFSFGLSLINLCVLLFDSTKGASYKRNLFLEKKKKFFKRGLPLKIIVVLEGTAHYKLLKRIDYSTVAKFVFVNENYEELYTLSEFDISKEFGVM